MTIPETFTGNITGMFWKDASDREVHKYQYNYDPVSRVSAANFSQLTGSGFSKTLVNYDVTSLTYDANGNIKSMNQYGLKNSGSSRLMDQLAYDLFVE